MLNKNMIVDYEMVHCVACSFDVWMYVGNWESKKISDEGPTLETLDFTIRIGSTPTFL